MLIVIMWIVGIIYPPFLLVAALFTLFKITANKVVEVDMQTELFTNKQENKSTPLGWLAILLAFLLAFVVVGALLQSMIGMV